MKFLALILLVAGATQAHAGVGAHGGNVVFCGGKNPVTLDEYNAMLPTAGGPVQTVDVSNMSEDEAFQFVRSRFDGSPFQEIFDDKTKFLGPVSSWIAADLKSIDDSNEPYALPSNCVRKTAAARQGASMYIDPSITSAMKPGQIGLLHAHEVLYAISNSDSSAPVRDLFRVIMAVNLDWERFLRAMEPFGKLQAWDYVAERNWKPFSTNPVKLSGEINPHNGPIERAGPTDLNLDYREFDRGGIGTYRQIDYMGLKCDLPSQSCKVVAQGGVGHGKWPSVVGCVLRVPSISKFTLTCPQLGGTAAFYLYVN